MCQTHALLQMIQGGHPVYHQSPHLCSEDAGAGGREEGGGLCCKGKQGQRKQRRVHGVVAFGILWSNFLSTALT